jgi:hypothetical protein
VSPGLVKAATGRGHPDAACHRPGEQDLAPERDQVHPGRAADVKGKFVDVAGLARLGGEQSDSTVGVAPGEEPDVQDRDGRPVLGDRRTRPVENGRLPAQVMYQVSSAYWRLRMAELVSYKDAYDAATVAV